MPGKLFLVATPIGNLEDITHRALRVLREVQLIACEDTRHTRKLLTHYGINTSTTSYHEHNERQKALELVNRILIGSDVALVSDAGTPGISDPGFRLIQLAIENDLTVVPIPGPVALISALIASGFPTDQFFFGGFLPSRSNQRRARLASLAKIDATLIFYEAPHRIGESLRDAFEILGERDAVVARELTKLHETFIRGRLSELSDKLLSGQTKGEIVLLIDRTIIDAPKRADDDLVRLMRELEARGVGERNALKQAAKQLGLSKDEAFRRLQLARQTWLDPE